MTTRAKALLITSVVALVVVIVVVIIAMVNRPAAVENTTTPSAQAANSHVLDDAGADAPVLVEFLDFECEVCGAFFPIVEDLKAKYGDEVTFAFRYFPLPGHGNSVNAALAVEAAAQQGEFEAMYHHLFETQAEWGEQRESRPEIFRAFAEELGLDMAAFDAAVADPATQQRVEKDFAEGTLLGVTSTPTFFLDDKKLELNQLSDLTGALDNAIGR